MFVDRVLYGGPDEQRLALGALAGATAVGALGVGLPRPRLASYRVVTLAGIALSVAGLGLMAALDGRHGRHDRAPAGWPCSASASG